MQSNLNHMDNVRLLPILRTLKTGHSLRQYAEVVLADPEAVIQDLQPVRRSLIQRSVFRRKERAVALWLTVHANWSEDQRATLSETLSEVVERELKSRKPIRIALRWFRRGMLVSLLMLSPHLVTIAEPGFRDWGLYLLLAVMLTVLNGVFSFPISVVIDHVTLKRLCSFVEALGLMGRPDSMATIATASMFLALRDAANAALASVTARLHSDDYGTLPFRTVPALCRALTVLSDETKLVVLHALTVVGDGRAIGPVERCARMALPSDVAEAATNLLAILHQRVRDGQAASLLLRAGDAPADSGQTLLRVVHEQSDTDPAHLLRMAGSEGSEDQRP